MGWANSSLRFLHQLPHLPEAALRRAKGVVREDPLRAAFDAGAAPQVGAGRGGAATCGVGG